MQVAIIFGAAMAFLSVAFGAFGAHALKDKFNFQMRGLTPPSLDGISF